jgi:putative nucleotidyltransferase with HDIG domain
MEDPVEGYDLQPGEMWRHAMAVSVAAEMLVRELNIPAADVVFTAALLHDIGKPVMGSFVKDDLKKIEAATSRETPFEVAEQIVLGTNHAEVGALILKKWSFPPQIVEAVQFHHSPADSSVRTSIIDIVHVADVLSLMLGIGIGREGLQYEPSVDVTRRLGLKPFQLEKVASQTLQWASELSDVF